MTEHVTFDFNSADFDAALERHLADLHAIAEHVLAQPDPKPETVNQGNAGLSLVEGGRDELIEAVGPLKFALAGLDDRRRCSILSAVVHLVSGTKLVAGYGITPGAALIVFGEEQARLMRQARNRRNAEKIAKELEIVQAVQNEHLKWSLNRLLREVNNRLDAAGLKAISRATLDRRRNRSVN